MDNAIIPVPTEAQSKQLITIAPWELLQKHRDLAKMQDLAYWGSGELSIELQDLFYPKFSKAAIRKVVGEIYSIAINTVRDRERIAAIVPPALRNAYPYLKFSHWRNIIPAGKQKAQEMLIESEIMYEVEERGPSVDQILAWRNTEGMDATPPWIYRLMGATEKFEMVRDDPRADPQIRMICDTAVRDIAERAAKLKLERFQLKDGESEKS